MSNYLKMSRKTYVSWDEVDEFAAKLAEHVKSVGYTGVYGIPRGGLILAAMVSYRANVPLLMAPCKECVVVDDITATGAAMKNYAGRYKLAAMFKHVESNIDLQCFGRKVVDEWIVFPWE